MKDKNNKSLDRPPIIAKVLAIIGLALIIIGLSFLSRRYDKISMDYSSEYAVSFSSLSQDDDYYYISVEEYPCPLRLKQDSASDDGALTGLSAGDRLYFTVLQSDEGLLSSDDEAVTVCYLATEEAVIFDVAADVKAFKTVVGIAGCAGGAAFIAVGVSIKVIKRRGKRKKNPYK